MPAASIQISLRCAACGAVVPVNAYTGEAICWSCERRTPLDGSTWQLLLDAPLRETPTLPANVERNATYDTGVGTFARVFRSIEPQCAGCRTTLDGLAATLGGGRPWARASCPHCSRPVLVRAAPAALAAAGVIAIAGESEEQLAGGRAARAPVALSCTQCGGNLTVDGTARTIACSYCRATNYLPDALWTSLRSTPVLPWWLVFGGQAAASAARIASWDSLYDVVVDPQGNLYGFAMPDVIHDPSAAGSDADVMRELMLLEGGEGGHVGMLFCATRDGVLRWQRTGMPFSMAETRLAYAPSGHVLLWDRRRAEIVSADGRTVHRFGQDGPPLLLAGAQDLVVDADGSLLVRAENHALLRHDARGQRIPTWSNGGMPSPGGRVDEPWVHDLGKRPSHVGRCHLAAGWDGHLWAQASIAYDGHCELACFDRSGAKIAAPKIPLPDHVLLHHRPAIDARGCVTVLGKHVGGSRSEHFVFRIDAGLKRGRTLLGPRSRGGVVGRESHLAVAPDGTLFLLGDGGALRRFSPDGQIEHVSARAERADRGDRVL